MRTLILLAAPLTASGFLANSLNSQSTTRLYSTPDVETVQVAIVPVSPLPQDDLVVVTTTTARTKSRAIPFLECPQVLREVDMAGNYGFDPLRLAKTKEALLEYREAEIKHARLAMLVSLTRRVSERDSMEIDEMQ
jgi:Chlorophyll A-B binding protein